MDELRLACDRSEIDPRYDMPASMLQNHLAAFLVTVNIDANAEKAVPALLSTDQS
jgi:hypothetical protein